jgi:hypothetical protein
MLSEKGLVSIHNIESQEKVGSKSARPQQHPNLVCFYQEPGYPDGRQYMSVN